MRCPLDPHCKSLPSDSPATTPRPSQLPIPGSLLLSEMATSLFLLGVRVTTERPVYFDTNFAVQHFLSIG